MAVADYNKNDKNDDFGGNVCADIRTTIIVSSVVGAVTLVGLFFLFHFIR